MGALETSERYISDGGYADDPRASREERAAHEAAQNYADRLVRLFIAEVGGPFEQRLPTRAQCRTDELDFYARKVREGWAGMRSRMVAARLEALGLTLDHVQAWAKEGL